MSSSMRKFAYVVVFFFALPLLPEAQGKEFLDMFHPSITLETEYNDNLNLSSSNKKSDTTTTVRPGILFSNMDARSGIDLDYKLGIVNYWKNTELNYIGHNASLNAKYMARNHLNFYLKDTFVRSDEPRERDYLVPDSGGYVLSTQTQRSVYWRNVLAPTLEYQYSRESTVGLNYRNNLYRNQDPAIQSSREDYVNPFISHWFDSRNNVRLEYGFTKGAFDISPDLTGHMGLARYTYRLDQRSSLNGEYSYLARRFEAPGINYDIHTPSLGFVYGMDAAWSLSGQLGYFWKEPERGTKTDGVSYKLQLSRNDPKDTFSISALGGYNEDYFTSENLGFSRYNRLLISYLHRFERKLSAGMSGSYEIADYDTHRDKIWMVSGNIKYDFLKWLSGGIEASHSSRDSDLGQYGYDDNRILIRLTATY